MTRFTPASMTAARRPNTYRHLLRSPKYRFYFQILLIGLAIATVYNFSYIAEIPPKQKIQRWVKETGENGDVIVQGFDYIDVQDDTPVVLSENHCSTWDPALDPELDPPRCLKARQYRQVSSVLAREEEGKHPHWTFTTKHNLATLRSLLNCYLPTSHVNFTICPDRPLVVSGYWYTATILNGETSGEGIWQRYLMKEIEELGFFWIAVGPYENWVTAAEMLPDVYRILWNWQREIISCFTDPRCIAKDHYVPPEDAPDLSLEVPDEERGVIPLWALNIVDYWGTRPKERSHNDYWWGSTGTGEWSYHPLEQEWIATPWALPGGHFHLPYSMEEECLKLPTTPHADRSDDVLILAKRSSYFDHGYSPPREYFTQLSQEPGFNLISAAQVEEGHPLPEGLVSIGVQKYERYSEVVGGVKVMLGIGQPTISPSIYAAFIRCQGVPAVLPYFDKEPILEGWSVFAGPWQHGPASLIGPPYVYSYYNKNYTMMLESIQQAIKTPIERYIPDDMKSAFALSKMSEYLERDLQGMFRDKILQNGGQVPRLIANARERCIELNHCTEGFPAGRKPFRPT